MAKGRSSWSKGVLEPKSPGAEGIGGSGRSEGPGKAPWYNGGAEYDTLNANIRVEQGNRAAISTSSCYCNHLVFGPQSFQPSCPVFR